MRRMRGRKDVAKYSKSTVLLGNNDDGDCLDQEHWFRPMKPRCSEVASTNSSRRGGRGRGGGGQRWFRLVPSSGYAPHGPVSTVTVPSPFPEMRCCSTEEGEETVSQKVAENSAENSGACTFFSCPTRVYTGLRCGGRHAHSNLAPPVCVNHQCHAHYKTHV